jgi:hypothetical protein
MVKKKARMEVEGWKMEEDEDQCDDGAAKATLP